VAHKGVQVLAWSPWNLAYSVGVTLVALPLSAYVFHRSEFVFAEYV